MQISLNHENAFHHSLSFLSSYMLPTNVKTKSHGTVFLPIVRTETEFVGKQSSEKATGQEEKVRGGRRELI
jgi:hypothetical protein